MRWKLSQLLTRLALALSLITLLSFAGVVPNRARADEPAVAPAEEVPADDSEPQSLEDEPLEPVPLEEQPAADGAAEPAAEKGETETPDAAPQAAPASDEPGNDNPVEELRDPYADAPAAIPQQSAQEPSDKVEASENKPTTTKKENAAPAVLPRSPKAVALWPVKPLPSVKPAAKARIESKPESETKPEPAPSRIPLDPATLDGVHPGTTTRDQLHERWGQPQRSQRIAGGAREFFEFDKLGRVQAIVLDDLVDSLTVHIERPLPLEAVAKRLAVDDVEPVAVYDEQGDLLGTAYPERGVLLGYTPKSRPPLVFQIVVEPIDAQPFLARAEAKMQTRYAESLVDIEQALALAPDNPQAHHLRSELLLRCGKIDESLKSAERAGELEPQAARHRLLLAKVLAAAGDFPLAMTRVRGVLDEPKLDDLDATRAWCQWGDYLAHSHRRDFAEAIKHHQQAIALAEPLLASPDHATRRAAKELLLDAHLGVAYDIGHGRWQQKTAAVAKWINRAAVIADDLVRTEKATADARLRVYAGALAAITGINEPPDVSTWIAGTRQLGQKTFEEAKDPAYRAQLAWQVGRALSDAVEIETARGRSDEAFTAGSLARSLLEEAKSVAHSLPIYNYECGKLCFRMGVAYAIERDDHAQAVVWFDRAAPLLESPVPAAAIDAGAHGETFVSMAVSYWEQENRPEALRLTNQGLKMMEQAVEDNTLDATALSVPYGNLSAMHEELGDAEQAKWCADLAARYDGSTKK